jgi:hypothetical protein
MLTGPFPWDDPADSNTCIIAYPGMFGGNAGLLRGFLGFEHRAPLVLSALGAGAMGKLLLVAVRALRNASCGKEVVGAAKSGAAR